MPCVFCIAVFAVVGAALTTAAVDKLEDDLREVSTSEPNRTVDTGAVAAIEADIEVPKVRGGSGIPSVPVTVTLHRRHERVRIQIRSHDLTEAEYTAVQDRIAKACGLDIVSRELQHDPRVDAALHGPSDLRSAGGIQPRTRRRDRG